MNTRINEPPEPIVLHGFRAYCNYCDGIIMMMRDQKTLALQPDVCWCILCGQSYFVENISDLREYEARQWREKFERENRPE